MKDWFKARNIWGAAILSLPDEDAGRLAKAIWGYTMNGVVEDLGAYNGMFAMILMMLQQDEAKEADISEKRAVAGATGGKANAHKPKQKQANALFASSEQANEANADNKNKNKNIDIKERDIPTVYQERKQQRSKFTPPSLDEVADYCASRNNGINPQHFIDYYSARGWYLKPGQQVKDWKACVRTWEANEKARSPTTKRVIAQDFKQRDYSDVPDEMMSDLAKKMRAFKEASS